jgi:hypothetical protein
MLVNLPYPAVRRAGLSDIRDFSLIDKRRGIVFERLILPRSPESSSGFLPEFILSEILLPNAFGIRMTESEGLGMTK